MSAQQRSKELKEKAGKILAARGHDLELTKIVWDLMDMSFLLGEVGEVDKNIEKLEKAKRLLSEQ